MYCSKCGNAVTANAAYCQVCGTPVPGAAAQLPGAPVPAQPGTFAAPAGPLASAGAVSPHWLPPLSRAYAGFWLRLVAHLVDGALLGIVASAVIVPLGLFGGIMAAIRAGVEGRPPDPAVIAALATSFGLFFLIATAGTWLYYAYFESSEWQGTVGKKLLNLIVTDLEGRRITFGRATGRYFSKFITALIPLGIGYILAGITEKKQALHDMIASTLVLRA